MLQIRTYSVDWLLGYASQRVDKRQLFFFIINLKQTKMRNFVECMLLMVCGACSWAVAIMLVCCSLPTMLDSIILYIMAAMFAIGGTIAFIQYLRQWPFK